MDTLWQIIKNSNKSLFRFESLQDYSAEDGQDKVQHFINTGSLLEHPNTNTWWNEMKKRNDFGMETVRVRLAIEPLTDYTKMELAYLKEAMEYSGDDIRIIKNEIFKNLDLGKVSDFWLIDDSQAFVMKYGDRGKYLGSEPVENIGKYLTFRKKLLESSVPL